MAHLYAADPGRFAKQQAYNLDKWSFGAAHGLFEVCWDVWLLASGFLPRTWDAAGALLARWGPPRAAGSEVWQSVVWTLLTSAIFLVVSIPWSAYRTFVLEARHGFNKTTPRTFLLDMVKTASAGL